MSRSSRKQYKYQKLESSNMKSQMSWKLNKAIVLSLAIIFFGTLSVFAGNIIAGQNGIQASYFSEDGSEGLTQNVTYTDGDGNPQTFIIKNGLIISATSSANSSGFPTSGLISYYKLDATSGSVIDSYGSNNGTSSGATRGTVGKINYAYGFDGSSDYINFGDVDDMDIGTNDDISFSVWVKPNSYSSTGVIFAKIYGAASKYYDLTLFTNGKFRFHNNQPSDLSIYSNDTVSVGNWYHIVVTRNGTDGEIRIYINGALDNSATPASPADNSNAGNFIVGNFRDDTSDGFDGVIDEIGVWDRLLTTEEISDLYNDGDGLTYS